MRRKTKHLCNYCFMPGQEKAILKTGKTLEQFVAGLGLDGSSFWFTGMCRILSRLSIWLWECI